MDHEELIKQFAHGRINVQQVRNHGKSILVKQMEQFYLRTGHKVIYKDGIMTAHKLDDDD